MFRQLPFGFVQGIYPCCRDSNDPATVSRAISQRIGAKLPCPKVHVVERFAGFVRRFLDDHVDPLGLTELMTFDEWIQDAPYTIQRKEELRGIYRELHGQLPTVKQSQTIKCFIKTESYPVLDLIKDGRGIMSRSDWAKVAMGPAFASIERKVYELKKPDGDPYFIKHIPVPERYKYVAHLKRAGARYLITDYTAFESSFSSQIMKACEVQLYRHMLPYWPNLANYIDRTLTGVNRLKFPNGTKARIKGRRMSGDMCTSLGNGFTNLMLMHFFCEEADLSVDGFVEGDDGVFSYFGNLPDGFAKRFEDLGFVIKMAEVDDPALGGFCGIVAADGGSIRDPVRFLQTFGWTTSFIDGSPALMMQLLRAKALSAIYESPQCPIVRAVAERALALTEGVEPRFVFDGYHAQLTHIDVAPFAPSQATRELFSYLYGVDPVTQVYLEGRVHESNDVSFLANFLPHHLNHDFIGSRFVGP